MVDEEPMIVTCADDLNEGELQNQLDALTDLEVHLDIDVDGLSVEQGPGSWMFSYPFDLQDVLDWTYYFETDYTVRYEILDDVQRLLARHPSAGRNGQAIEAFVEPLLLTDWIASDGSDLMIMDVDGEPLELSDHYRWTTAFTGDVQRPYRPDPSLPTRARLYPDGRLVLTPTGPDTQSVEVDLTVVDLDEIFQLL